MATEILKIVQHDEIPLSSSGLTDTTSFVAFQAGAPVRVTGAQIKAGAGDGSGGSPSVFDVTGHGVDNTGAENIRVPMQALIASVGEQGGGVILMPPGTYLFSPDENGLGLCSVWDNITIHAMPGAKIVLNDPNKYMRALGYNGVGIISFGINPGADTWYREWAYRNYAYDLSSEQGDRPPVLSQSAARDERVLHVDAVSEVAQTHMAPGSWVFIMHLGNDARYLNASPGQETRRTEFAQVLSCTEDTITLAAGLLDDYDIALGDVTVTPVRMLRNNALTGSLEIHGLPKESAVAPNGSGACGVYGMAFNGLLIEGVRAVDHENAAVKLERGVYATVRDVDVVAPRQAYDINTTGYYGIEFSGVQNAVAENISGRNVRHLVDTGGAIAVSRNVLFDRIKCHGSYAAPISTHAVVNVTVTNVEAQDCMGGFVFRGKNLIADNIRLIGSSKEAGTNEALSIGIWVSNAAFARLEYGNVKITNFEAAGFGRFVVLNGVLGDVQINEWSFTHRIGDTVLPAFTILSPSYQSIRIGKGTADYSGRDWEHKYSGVIEVRDPSNWGAVDLGPIELSDVTVQMGLECFVYFMGGATIGRAERFTLTARNLQMFYDHMHQDRPSGICVAEKGAFGRWALDDIQMFGFTRSASLLDVSNSGVVMLAPPVMRNCGSYSQVTGRLLVDVEANGATFMEGDRVTKHFSSIANGTVLERICTDGGTVGTITGVTGAMAEGSDLMVLDDDNASLVPGQRVKITGAGADSADLWTWVLGTSGRSIRFDSPADTAVSGAAVEYWPPQFQDLLTVVEV